MNPQAHSVRVAVVDDSTFIRKAITCMLEDDPQLEVVGSAGSGEELLHHFEEWKPDVVTLDLDMPGMGGLETLDRILAIRSLPVIILSTHSGSGAPLTIEALHRGATDFIDKQKYSLVDFEALRNVLVETIFQVTGQRRQQSMQGIAEVAPVVPREPAVLRLPTAYDLVVLGASTGGPPTLQSILEAVGEALPVPILIVQHMPVGFTMAFAERLNAHLPMEVRETHGGEVLLPGHVYIAPAGIHLRLRRMGADLLADVNSYPQDLLHAPSIDVLFESAAEVVGRRTVAALLTGMGRDGATGMSALKHRGAYTLCQSEETCVVFGMPRAALSLGAVEEIAAPRAMGSRIRQLLDLPTL